MNACLDPDVWFIFNLHRELFILSCTDVKNKAGAYLLKENILLERRPLAHGGEVPILSDPLLGVNCPCTPCISITPLHPLPSSRAFILNKDDINKPDTSVGQN
jgi:hypothetical protein